MGELFKGTSFEEYEKYLLDYVLEKNPRISDLYTKFDRKKIDIETVLNEDSLSEREFVELIASRRRIGYDPTVGGGNKAAEDETDRLYAKNPWKFVEEFLQNADDCEYEGIPKVDIIVDERESTVEFIYNELGFTKRDIWAIAAFSQSTKNNDIVENQINEGVFYREKTGRKGKGFKSVFSLKAENVIVQIRSNGYSFKLDNKIGRVLPVWEEDTVRMDGKTHVIVKLVNPSFNLNGIYPEFKSLFCVERREDIFAKSPFIFMHRIKSVHIKRIFTSGIDEFTVSYIEDKNKTLYENEIKVNPKKTILAGIANEGRYYEEQFQEGCIKITHNSERKPDIQVVRYTRMIEDEQAYRNYSIMSPVLKKDDIFICENGALFRTFPMSLHEFNMPMAIDAPFELNPDRSGIQYRDEKTDTINASDWNSIVSTNLFKAGGVYESFLLWIRTIQDIRMDKYIRAQNIILFEDRNNSDGHGNDWIDRVNIEEINKNIPVFRLFANIQKYTSLDNAEIVNKDLFTWPCVDVLFRSIIGDNYQERIISDIYIGSQLFHQSGIDKEGFASSINAYLDIVESELCVDSQEMFDFVNKSLYPFLIGNMASIKKADVDAFKNMQIYFSVLHVGDDDIVVRENLDKDLKWVWDSNKHTSINKYRVIDSSPVDMTGLKKIIEEYFWAQKLDIYFAPNNINKTARNCKCWKDVYELIEATYHFGSEVSLLSFECLKNYVICETLDAEENFFRNANVKKIIPDEDIISLASYSQSVENMVSMLKKMGTKKPHDYFDVVGNYLQFKKDTLDLLNLEIELKPALKDIRRVQKESGKTINVTYDEIKNCNRYVVAFLVNENYHMIPAEPYATLCDYIQEEEAYWTQEEILSKIILIRACAGASKIISNKDTRQIIIDIDTVLNYRLDICVSKIASKNKLSLIEVTPSTSFSKIPDEEIQALLSILRPENQPENVQYYKGDISQFGSEHQYLKDGKGGHIYLNCDENGDYKKALEDCVKKSFDTESLRVIDEMEHQYSGVKKDILEMLNRTGGDLGKTYDEIERRFESYNNQEIISILSWFRYSGYTNALGNGNINNEKEIEDDYRNNPWKFIYEFIQNVDDCSFSGEPPYLNIDIDNDLNAITFEYNETGFTLDDVKALTKFGDSIKSDSLEELTNIDGVFDREKTGRKGRGFKSVFSLPGQGVVVHVCSNGFSFKFVKRLGSIIPIWEDVEKVPETGTRITVEGFDLKYLPKLTNNIEKMFGISDISSFYSICPILYLRKIHKVKVNNFGNRFSIGIVPVTQDTSEECFEFNQEEIVAGIIKDNEYRKSLWEVLHVVIEQVNKKTEFNSLRYTGMFSDGTKTRTASIFAPLMNESVKENFVNGALYRTLPLDDNSFELPFSINAPFETNSGRSAVADTEEANNEVVHYVFNELLEGFFMTLRSVENVSISEYIPLHDVFIFKDYKNLEEENLYDIIKTFPVLKTYDDTGYVSCNDAEVLFAECYEWEDPVHLAQCFGNRKKILIKRKYIGSELKCLTPIDFHNDRFVESMNLYLDGIDLDDLAMANLIREHIYPYIDKSYETISLKYKMSDRKDELKKLAIFMFVMADGEWVRESALGNNVWMKGVPSGFDSFGRHRNIEKSSITSFYSESKWLKEFHKVVEFNSAFTSDILKGNTVRDWGQAEVLIQTVLYYEVEKKPNIPFLRECVLTEEFDNSENLFRIGYLYSNDDAILRHVIKRDDLIAISEITRKTSEEDLHELASTLKEMGLKEADDFFEEIGKNLYKLNDSTIALLEEYCDCRAHCDETVKAIDGAFRRMKSTKSGIQLHISYDDLERCNYLVFAKLFEFEVLSGDVVENMAYALCEKDTEDTSMDYIEAYFRALSIIEEMPYEKVVNVSLADVIDRQLGSCIQKCKLKNLKDLHLYIEAEDIIDYPSAAIDQALQWLEDESKVSATYQYYTYDLAEAFPEKTEGIFIFDDEKVILNVSNDENSMLEFVQKRYKGNDASFKSLVQIISEQNSLKGKWSGTKEEYILRLSKYRESTWNQRKVLFPNYDEYINEANGQSVNYVIPELLQNINDCLFAPGQSTRTLDVDINTNNGTMMLRYDEKGFDYSNVYSITAIGRSSKHDKSEGEKGLGFKKVFTMFSEVEIYSNGFCFKLAASKNTVPKWIASKEKQEKYLVEGKTVMIFTVELRYKNKLSELLKAWKSIMKGEYVGSEVSPLFLKNIDYINVSGCEERYSRTEMVEKFHFKSVQILPLYKKYFFEGNISEDEIDDVVKALKQRRKCQAMSDDAKIEEYLNSLLFEICIPKKVKQDHERKGCFYSTLPTKIGISVPMFINIPLELTTGRDGKVDDSIYNETIMEMLFKPLGEDNKSIFIALMEEFAKELPETFILDYFSGDFSKFLYEISDHKEDREQEIKDAFDTANLFKAYKSDEMVSLNKSYSVEKIVYQYFMNVDNPKMDIKAWMAEHNDSVADLNLILPSKIKDGDALEKFAKDIESTEGYFPVKSEEVDLAIEYVMDEYGYIGGEEDDERTLDRSNPKDKFIIETLLPYLVEHIEESNSKGTTISQISSMYVFPYRTNEGIKIGSLGEPGISWYFDKNTQKQVVSLGGYRILDDSVLPEKQAANFRKTFSEYCGITEFSDHAVIKDLLEKMSMETDYTSRWWTYAYDVFKLWRKEDFNSSLEKATEGMDNNKFLFSTDLYPENLKQRLLENDVFSDIKETSFKTCFWKLMKSHSDEEKVIDVLIRMGVPHTFVVDGKVNAHLLRYFTKVSENSDYPVESWEKAFAECELSHDIMLQIYREDEDALFEIAKDGDINDGIVVKNIMGAYIPLSWDLFFASDELEINNSEEDDLEEDKDLCIDSDLECLHINGKVYSLDLLSRLENVHEYSEVCKAADYYNLGVDCEIVEFYKWIWLYSHHDELVENILYFFTNRVKERGIKNFQLVENILYFFTDDDGERVTVPEEDMKFVLSVLECGDISDAGYLFDINLDAESCFSNADVINKISRQFSDIYCNISADLEWFDVSDYLQQIIAAVNSVSNIQRIAADSIWDHVYLVDGEPDYYDDIYVRCKLFDDGYEDVLLIWNSSDEDSYIRALAKYVSEEYNTEVVVACAEAFDWKAEYLQLAKKIREFISEEEPIKKETEMYGYIADMADVLTFGEEKQIWMYLYEQREKIVQQQVGKMPIKLENWRTFLADKYNGRCQVCGNKTATGAQNAHFFTYRISKESQSKLANMNSNMFCLCPSCHGEMQYGSYMGKNMREILEKAKLYFEYYASKSDSGEMEENYESLVAELADDSGELRGFSKPIICDVIVNGKQRKMAFSWEHFIRLAFILADAVYLDNEVKNEC